MEQRKESLISQISTNCFRNKPSILICTSENCKQTAFVCKDQSCQCFQKQHDGCSLDKTKYFINNIQKQRREITKENSNAFDTVIKIYEEMIEKISKEKEQFMDFVELFGLEENMRKFVNLLRDGRYQEIDGDLAHKVKVQIKRQKFSQFEIFQNSVKQVQESTIKELDTILLKIMQLKQSQNLEINSKIITNGKDLKRVKSFMPQAVKQFQLLYRASENNFSIQTFHEKCDRKTETLTIIETQFGTVIGGYTPLNWKFSQTPKYQQDASRQSFLFYVSVGEKHELINESALFVLESNVKEFDLIIVKQNSFNEFSRSYNSSKYQNKQKQFLYLKKFKRYEKAINIFASNERKFEVKQYEVFKVVWK